MGSNKKNIKHTQLMCSRGREVTAAPTTTTTKIQCCNSEIELLPIFNAHNIFPLSTMNYNNSDKERKTIYFILYTVQSRVHTQMPVENVQFNSINIKNKKIEIATSQEIFFIRLICMFFFSQSHCMISILPLIMPSRLYASHWYYKTQ